MNRNISGCVYEDTFRADLTMRALIDDVTHWWSQDLSRPWEASGFTDSWKWASGGGGLSWPWTPSEIPLNFPMAFLLLQESHVTNLNATEPANHRWTPLSVHIYLSYRQLFSLDLFHIDRKLINTWQNLMIGFSIARPAPGWSHHLHLSWSFIVELEVWGLLF